VVYALFRMVRGPAVFEAVVALFTLSAIGGAAFLLGRAHARQRHEKKRGES
jgi:hypothetical protein